MDGQPKNRMQTQNISDNIAREENIRIKRQVEELEIRLSQLIQVNQKQEEEILILNKQMHTEIIKNIELQQKLGYFQSKVESQEKEAKNFQKKVEQTQQSHSDPMDIEQDQDQQLYKSTQRKLQCWYCKKSGHFVRQCYAFQQKQEDEETKLQQNMTKLYCTPEGKLYRRKMFRGGNILLDIAKAKEKRYQEWLEYPSNWKKSEKKNKLFEEYVGVGKYAKQRHKIFETEEDMDEYFQRHLQW